jgi:divalent metal cation (Fe/Co/Zn/Cd) transporter
VLLDYAPGDKVAKIENVLNTLPEIDSFHSLKIRTAGADTFVSVSVILNPHLKLNQAHEICDLVEREICKEIIRCDVFVHVEPQNQKTDNKQ